MPAIGQEKTSRKQREFKRREQEILDAALNLFEGGTHWEQVTVEQISKKAEIGKGTVYKHFSCKDEIYAHITIIFTQRILEAFCAASEQAEIIDKLKELIRIAFVMFLENPAEARVSFYCKREDFRERLSDDLKNRFEEQDNQFASFVGTILQPGIDKGLFPDKPVEHLMMGLEATFDGAISMIWNGDISCHHAEDQEAYVNIISEYMLSGLVGIK